MLLTYENNKCKDDDFLSSKPHFLKPNDFSSNEWFTIVTEAQTDRKNKTVNPFETFK